MSSLILYSLSSNLIRFPMILVTRAKAVSAKYMPGSAMMVNSCSSLGKQDWRDEFIAETESSKSEPEVKPPPMLSTCIRGKPSREAISNTALAAAIAHWYACAWVALLPIWKDTPETISPLACAVCHCICILGGE